MDKLISDELSLRHLPDVSYDSSLSFQLPASSSRDDQLLEEDDFLQGADCSFTTPMPQRILQEPLTLEHLTPQRPRPDPTSPPQATVSNFESTPPGTSQKTRSCGTPASTSGRPPSKYPFRIPKEDEPLTPSRLDLLRNEVKLLKGDSLPEHEPKGSDCDEVSSTSNSAFGSIQGSVLKANNTRRDTDHEQVSARQMSFAEDDSSMLCDEGAAGRLLAYSNAISQQPDAWRMEVAPQAQKKPPTTASDPLTLSQVTPNRARATQVIGVRAHATVVAGSSSPFRQLRKRTAAGLPPADRATKKTKVNTTLPRTSAPLPPARAGPSSRAKPVSGGSSSRSLGLGERKKNKSSPKRPRTKVVSVKGPAVADGASGPSAVGPAIETKADAEEGGHRNEQATIVQTSSFESVSESVTQSTNAPSSREPSADGPMDVVHEDRNIEDGRMADNNADIRPMVTSTSTTLATTLATNARPPERSWQLNKSKVIYLSGAQASRSSLGLGRPGGSVAKERDNQPATRTVSRAGRSASTNTTTNQSQSQIQSRSHTRSQSQSQSQPQSRSQSQSQSSQLQSSNATSMSRSRTQFRTVHPIPDFKALHSQHDAEMAARKENIVPVVPLGAPCSFTEARAQERAKFEETVKEKQQQAERQLEEKRREEREREEMETREMRKRAIPKAHEVPAWYADAPKKETRT